MQIVMCASALQFQIICPPKIKRKHFTLERLVTVFDASERLTHRSVCGGCVDNLTSALELIQQSARAAVVDYIMLSDIPNREYRQ